MPVIATLPTAALDTLAPALGLARAPLAALDLAWPTTPGGLTATLVPLAGAALYVAYHLVGLRLSVWQRRLWGAFILGLVPLIAASLVLGRGPAAFGLAPGDVGLGLGVAAAFAALTVPSTWLTAGGDNARARGLRARYPEARPASWDRRATWINAATWAVYLLSYELLFRGLLLFPLAETVGAWPAIALVAFPYIAVHLDRHPAELLGTFASGVGFGALALATGSILGPWIAHTCVAVGTDLATSREARRAARMAGGRP